MSTTEAATTTTTTTTTARQAAQAAEIAAIRATPVVIREFASVAAAKAYRHETGCGGLIFGEDEERPLMIDGMGAAPAVLFPPGMTPAQVFRHPITRGRSGALYCN